MSGWFAFLPREFRLFSLAFFPILFPSICFLRFSLDSKVQLQLKRVVFGIFCIFFIFFRLFFIFVEKNCFFYSPTILQSFSWEIRHFSLSLFLCPIYLFIFNLFFGFVLDCRTRKERDGFNGFFFFLNLFSEIQVHGYHMRPILTPPLRG